MKKIIPSLFLFSVCLLSFGQQSFENIKPVKNLILMIPDGTSIGVISSARYYKLYKKQGDGLNVDPYFCGIVRTRSSDAPVAESASSTSCYVTGVLSQAGHIATYPEADPKNDFMPMDASKNYQPLTTLLEAAKKEESKSTGLVVTCDFPDATPADCAAHYYDRDQFECIAPQMVYQDLDVMFGGGYNNMTEDMKQHLKQTNTQLFSNVADFRAYEGDQKIWALFNGEDLPYDLDRDDNKYPSLSEMTGRAISQLNKNPNGFFLMVEGSKVDNAAHANDPVACMTEFLAFDKAVGEAIKFAKKDGQTAVVILTDHGNSGFTLARKDFPKDYTHTSLDGMFDTVGHYQHTASWFEGEIRKTNPADFKALFKKYASIDITDQEVKTLLDTEDKHESDHTKVNYSPNLFHSVVTILNARTPFGFTTGGHTGEDVQLAVYNPNDQTPKGFTTNIELNHYMYHLLGLKTSLSELTQEMYTKHTEVFKGINYVLKPNGRFATLTIKKGKNTLIISSFKSVAMLNGKPIGLGTPAIYIDKNQTFYIPENLAQKLK